MKRCDFLWMLVFIVLLGFAGIVQAKDNGIIYGNFGVTELRYEDQSDWDQIVKDVFGSEYRVADWNDLKEFYNNGGNLLNLYDGLGMTEYKNSAYVTRNGDRSYSSSRYYFASRHEHNKPGSYLAHDNIDNSLLSLGSWHGSNNIMGFKKNDVSIFVVDGLSFDAIFEEGEETGLRSGYLYEALLTSGQNGMNLGITKEDIYSFGNNCYEKDCDSSLSWSGDANYTEKYMGQLIDQLKYRYDDAIASNKKFVLVSHSWGTVLSTLALGYLQSISNYNIEPDLFITLSSPFGSSMIKNTGNKIDDGILVNLNASILTYIVKQWKDTEDQMKKNPIYYEGEKLSFQFPTAKKWINYWAMGDIISGPLNGVLGDTIIDIKLDPNWMKRTKKNTHSWHAITSLSETKWDDEGMPDYDIQVYEDKTKAFEIRNKIADHIRFTLTKAPELDVTIDKDKTRATLSWTSIEGATSYALDIQDKNDPARSWQSISLGDITSITADLWAGVSLNVAITPFQGTIPGKQSEVKSVYLSPLEPLLHAEESNVTLQTGESRTVSINGGTGYYTVSSNNAWVTTAVLKGSVSQYVEITGLAAGNATITIEDSSLNTVTISVKVEKSSSNLSYCGMNGKWDEINNYCIGEYGHDSRSVVEQASSSTGCGGYYKTYAYYFGEQLTALFISNGHCRASSQSFNIWPSESLRDHCIKHGGTGNYLWRYHSDPDWQGNTVGVQCEVDLGTM